MINFFGLIHTGKKLLGGLPNTCIFRTVTSPKKMELYITMHKKCAYHGAQSPLKTSKVLLRKDVNSLPNTTPKPKPKPNHNFKCFLLSFMKIRKTKTQNENKTLVINPVVHLSMNNSNRICARINYL